MSTKYTIIAAILFCFGCQSNTNNTSSRQPSHSDSLQNTTADSRHNTSAIGAGEISPDYLIVPGKSIGKTMVDQDVEILSKNLGKPDFSDAAMGKAWLVWFGKKDEHNNRTELDIYTTYKDSSMSSKVVKEIRTTSSAFMTRDSVKVYVSLATIQKYFPHIKYLEKYKDGAREISIYDDVQQGIAFDIAKAGNQQICIGITVHEPGKRVNDVYIRLQPEKQ